MPGHSVVPATKGETATVSQQSSTQQPSPIEVIMSGNSGLAQIGSSQLRRTRSIITHRAKGLTGQNASSRKSAVRSHKKSVSRFLTIARAGVRRNSSFRIIHRKQSAGTENQAPLLELLNSSQSSGFDSQCLAATNVPRLQAIQHRTPAEHTQRNHRPEKNERQPTAPAPQL